MHGFLADKTGDLFLSCFVADFVTECAYRVDKKRSPSGKKVESTLMK